MPYLNETEVSLLTISEKNNIGQCIEKLNSSGYQICIVRDNDRKVTGIVTDSDIRKALLYNLKLNDNIKKIMNKRPFTVNSLITEDEIKLIMLKNHYAHIPVLDTEERLKGLYIAEYLYKVKTKDEAIMIMAGGRGKRLMPLTKDCPKPMLPINGKPILELIINKAKEEGYINFILSVNYLSHIIKDYFKDGRDFGINIEYVEESHPLGTAGSLSLIREVRKTQDVIVINGDVLTNISFNAVMSSFISEKSDGMIVVRQHEWEHPFGVVHNNGLNLTGIEEKPIYKSLVNTGIYIIGKNLLNTLEQDTYCDMPDLFQKGLDKNLKLSIYPMHEEWIDIGRSSQYELAEKQYHQYSR